MPMPPHPTFDFSKVVDTHVTHTLYDTKLVRWCQRGSKARSPTLRHTLRLMLPNSVSQTLTDAQSDPLHTDGLLGVYFGDQRCLCQLDSLAKGVLHR